MLIIQPIGGLCNRMRAINSALQLSKLRGDKLTILWFKNSELNCDLKALFQIPPKIRLLTITSKWDIRKMFLQGFCQFVNNDIIVKNLIKEDPPSVNDSEIPKTIENTSAVISSVHKSLQPDFQDSLGKNCYIATEEQFMPENDYSFFKPTQALAARIQQITSASPPSVVGVHIRRTDSLPSIEVSSSDAFVIAMREELSNCPSTCFYLATDDAREEALMKELFPGKIITMPQKVLDRNSPQGIQDALVELYCLASTKKLIGSHYSSFSDIAALLYGIPKIVAGK